MANHLLAADKPFSATAHRPDRAATAVYGFLLESLTEFAVFGVSLEGLVLSWNAGAERLFGYRTAEILGQHFQLIFTADDIAAGGPADELAEALGGVRTQHDRWHIRKDGTPFWGTNTVQPMFDAAGAVFGCAKMVRDGTSTYLAQAALSDSEQRMRLLIESVAEYAIFSIAMDGRITSWNNGAQTAFGYTEAEAVGRSVSILYTEADVKAGYPGLELSEATKTGHYAAERWMVRKDGTSFLSSDRVSPLKRGADGDVRGFVKIAHDITEREIVAAQMRRRAMNDQLTNVPNRGTFFEHVQRAIDLMKRRSANAFAVLFIDLDDFKTVNDTYGHVLADGVLESTARRLEQCVRSGDIVARVGGDEFAILLTGIGAGVDADDAGERVVRLMSVPIALEGYNVHVTASVGVALGGVEHKRPEDILRQADAAMYVAKSGGGAQAVRFRPEMSAMADRRSRQAAWTQAPPPGR